MFAGLSNQISGFVAEKMGKGGAPGGEGEEGGVAPPVDGAGADGAAMEGGEGGEAGAGGAMGFAQGLMMKAAAAKQGIAEKASGLNAGNLTVRKYGKW